MSERDKRIDIFASIQQFPVLAKLHHHESPTITEGQNVKQRTPYAHRQQTLKMSPRKPSSPNKRSQSSSPKSPKYRNRVKHQSNASDLHPKPFVPSSPSKAKALTERKLVSVIASSPYIPKHKIGCLSASEKKKKFIHGEFKPSSITNKKGSRLEDIFLNSADVYTKTMQMEFLKKRAKRNLEKLNERQKQQLQSRQHDMPKKNGTM